MRTLPLVVDLDGTLTPVDTLIESFVRLTRTKPLRAVGAACSILHGRSALKRRIAEHAEFDVSMLPLREDLVDFLKQQRGLGRRVVLATAADVSIANAMAARVGVFDAVHASDGTRNLKGKTKLEVILREVGAEFVYAGDSSADLPIWHEAKAAILVGAGPRVADQVRRAVPVEREFLALKPTLITWLKALRIHQWLKNLLVFLPLLTSFAFTSGASIASAAMAFLSFGLMASATYLGNDLWDLDADRQHPRKRHRPFASGALPIKQGLLVAAGLLVLASGLALVVSQAFLGMLLVYLVITTAYSWALKHYVLVDVVVLASL